jgi:3-phenylpropionate/cinnamic acid dioxygenase small subunit
MATRARRRHASRSSTVVSHVERLLVREAALLDAGRLEEWLSLYTEDATYWVPLEPGQIDPLTAVSLIHDDRALLEVRVRQFRHPRAHARTPMPRTVHQIGNVDIVEDDGRELRVVSTLVMVEYRNERQRIWGGRVEHRLRRVGDGLRIAAKRVDLVNSESELEGIVALF